MRNSESTPDTALALLNAYERELTELRASLREMLGLFICQLRDPGGRVVTYGYHWQRSHYARGTVANHLGSVR